MLDLRNIDCFELLSQTGNNTIDLVLTDPPYGMNFQSNARKVKYDKIQNDENLDWLSIWVDELRRVVKSDSHLYIWCSWHNIEKFKIEISRQFKIKNVIIWSKGGGAWEILMVAMEVRMKCAYL